MATDLDRGVTPDRLAPITPTLSRSDLIRDSLRSSILSGAFAPGETLVERRIAEQLGVSKTPVREAMIVLTREGLLEMSRNRGSRVRELSPTEVRHIYEQRFLLEPWAAASAASSTSAQRSARAALDDAKEFAAQGRQHDLASANRRFHQSMYRSCDNSFVVRSLDNLQDLTSIAVVGVLWEKWPTWEAEAHQHEEMYDAAVDGDAVTIERLMRTHIALTLDRLKGQTSRP